MSKNTVFVVMPFAGNDDFWEVGIKETVESLGWDCVRADQIDQPGFIVNQIYELIGKADIIIGEMTGRNSNVFYEIGFAHALGKPVVLLAASKDDLTAFDTQGFRHHLHGGKILEVRRILRKVLSDLRLPGQVELQIPGGRTVYEWPAPDYELPSFKWTSRSRETQLDVHGGQQIQTLDQIGKVISVSNTDEYWNWIPKSSIMRFRRTKDFHIGDKVLLLIEGRADSDIEFQFLGDGDYHDPETKQGWVSSWGAVKRQISPTPAWTTWSLEAEVQPTRGGYEPAERGTTLYLMTHTGTGSAFVRRIRIVHVPKL